MIIRKLLIITFLALVSCDKIEVPNKQTSIAKPCFIGYNGYIKKDDVVVPGRSCSHPNYFRLVFSDGQNDTLPPCMTKAAYDVEGQPVNYFGKVCWTIRIRNDYKMTKLTENISNYYNVPSVKLLPFCDGVCYNIFSSNEILFDTVNVVLLTKDSVNIYMNEHPNVVVLSDNVDSRI